MDDNLNNIFSQQVESIEEAYEYMLAYAAQGREEDVDGAEGIRNYLERLETALENLSADVVTSVSATGLEVPKALQDFIEVLGQDIRRAQAAIRLVLAQSSISSQLIDNLNASIHIRVVLTDLFLIDETMK